MLYRIALAFAPRGVLANSQFLRPMTNGFMERSANYYDVLIIGVILINNLF
jgi:hypothetical protein